MSRILRSVAPTVLAGVLAAGAAIAQDSVFEPPADVGYTKPMASSADFATEAHSAANANYATNAGNSNYATNAGNANYAARAGAAGSSDYATRAGSAPASGGTVLGSGEETYGRRKGAAFVKECAELTGSASCDLDPYTVNPPGTCGSASKIITAITYDSSGDQDLTIRRFICVAG